mgnify:CR=1 FL=1
MNKAALLASALLAVTPLPALAEPVLLISIDGLRPGDVIVTFNGSDVVDSGQLSRQIQDTPIGSTATDGSCK